VTRRKSKNFATEPSRVLAAHGLFDLIQQRDLAQHRFGDPDWVVRFYNQRGTAEQHIKEGKYAFRWTRSSRKRFGDNEVRLRLHALAYNLATFLRCIDLPGAMAGWSLTSLHLKLIKIGARVVRHARAILAAVRKLQAPPSCA